jgi:transcriptional regulator with XRE-family HTH domain
MKATIPGERLRQWLVAAHLTQAELARLLSVDPGQVSRWCTGKAAPRPEYADSIVTLVRERGVRAELPQAGACVFFSTPMAALDTDAYESDRAAANAVYEELRLVGSPVYWAASQIASTDQFEAPDIATERNLAALTAADAFVYLQLRELTHPTSCLVEIGMAIACKKPVTVFAPSEESLPYVLRRFEPISVRAGFGRFRFYSIHSAADAVRLLHVHGRELIGLAPRSQNGAQ